MTPLQSWLLNCLGLDLIFRHPALALPLPLFHILRYTANLMISYFSSRPDAAIGSIWSTRLKIYQVFTNLT